MPRAKRLPKAMSRVRSRYWRDAALMPLCSRKCSKKPWITSRACWVETPESFAIWLDKVVTASRPSRPITLAAASSPIDSSRMAALSRSVGLVACVPTVLYPCFDDFSDSGGFFVHQQSQVFELDFQFRAGRRQAQHLLFRFRLFRRSQGFGLRLRVGRCIFQHRRRCLLVCRRDQGNGIIAPGEVFHQGADAEDDQEKQQQGAQGIAHVFFRGQQVVPPGEGWLGREDRL